MKAEHEPQTAAARGRYGWVFARGDSPGSSALVGTASAAAVVQCRPGGDPPGIPPRWWAPHPRQPLWLRGGAQWLCAQRI